MTDILLRCILSLLLVSFVVSENSNWENEPFRFYAGVTRNEAELFTNSCTLDLRSLHLRKGLVSSYDYSSFLYNYCSKSSKRGPSCTPGDDFSFSQLASSIQYNFVTNDCGTVGNTEPCNDSFVLHVKDTQVPFISSIQMICQSVFPLMVSEGYLLGDDLTEPVDEGDTQLSKQSTASTVLEEVDRGVGPTQPTTSQEIVTTAVAPTTYEIDFLGTCLSTLSPVVTSGTLSQKTFADFIVNYCQESDYKGEDCPNLNNYSFHTLPKELKLLFIQTGCTSDENGLFPCKDKFSVGVVGNVVEFHGNVNLVCESSLALLTKYGYLVPGAVDSTLQKEISSSTTTPDTEEVATTTAYKYDSTTNEYSNVDSIGTQSTPTDPESSGVQSDELVKESNPPVPGSSEGDIEGDKQRSHRILFILLMVLSGGIAMTTLSIWIVDQRMEKKYRNRKEWSMPSYGYDDDCISAVDEGEHSLAIMCDGPSEQRNSLKPKKQRRNIFSFLNTASIPEKERQTSQNGTISCDIDIEALEAIRDQPKRPKKLGLSYFFQKQSLSASQEKNDNGSVLSYQSLQLPDLSFLRWNRLGGEVCSVSEGSVIDRVKRDFERVEATLYKEFEGFREDFNRSEASNSTQKAGNTRTYDDDDESSEHSLLDLQHELAMCELSFCSRSNTTVSSLGSESIPRGRKQCEIEAAMLVDDKPWRYTDPLESASENEVMKRDVTESELSNISAEEEAWLNACDQVSELSFGGSSTTSMVVPQNHKKKSRKPKKTSKSKNRSTLVESDRDRS